MKKPVLLIVAALTVVLHLQTGCAAVRDGTGKAEASSVVESLVRSTQSWDGSLLPVYRQGRPEITILRITVPAGVRLDTHLHPVINAGVMIRGQLTVVTEDGSERVFRAGDALVEVVNKRHYGINQGTVPAEILVFYAGVTDTPITVVEPDRPTDSAAGSGTR